MASSPRSLHQTKTPTSHANLSRANSVEARRKSTGLMQWVKNAWTCYEGTFAISLLDRTEKIILHAFLFGVIFLLYIGISKYLPTHSQLIFSRAKYYIYGTDDPTH